MMNDSLPHGAALAVSSYSNQGSPADTDANSSFWRDAPRITIVNDNYGNEVPGHRTEVRSRWTKEHLHFLFACPYEQLYLRSEPKTDEKTDGLWNWDVAEAFIGSVHEPIRHYREFEMSPQGEWLDLAIDLDAPDMIAQRSWCSGFSIAARVDASHKVWYGAMKISYAAIEPGRPAAGNLLRINFFRSQGPNHVELAWQAPHQESFHAPERFGMLRLV